MKVTYLSDGTPCLSDYTPREIASLEGDPNEKVELIVDNTGRLVAATSNANDFLKKEVSWLSYFKEPFTTIIITREQYWAWKMDKLKIKGING